MPFQFSGASGGGGSAGPQGPQGEPGLVWRGAWSAVTAYSVNDAVVDGGSAYVAIVASTNSQPPSADWDLLAQKGNDGAAGPQGDPGSPGLVWRGAWSAITAYSVNDAVFDSGSAYVATAANTNSQPPSGDWDLLAQKGNDGAAGAGANVITSDTTYYISTSGSDETGDGSSGTPWATLEHAFAYIRDYAIRDDATVTLQLGDGAYSASSSVFVRHPNGNRIVIQGNTIANSVLSVQSTSGSAGNWSYVLNMGSAVDGIVAGDYVILRNAAGGTNPTRLLGVHKVTSVDAANTRITVTVKHRHGSPGSGAVTADATVVKVVHAFTGVSGIVIDRGCRLGGLNKLVLEGSGTSLTAGVYALDGGVLLDGSDVGASNFAHGFCADRGGILLVPSAVASGNTNYGFRAIRQSFISAATSAAIASGNSSDGFAAIENASVEASDSKSTGNAGSGYGAYWSGYGLYNRCESDGNTNSGFYAMVAKIEAGPTSANKAYGNGIHGFYAGRGSVITCGGAQANNNGQYGFYAEDMALIYTYNSTGTGNGTGTYSPAQGSQGNDYAFNAN